MIAAEVHVAGDGNGLELVVAGARDEVERWLRDEAHVRSRRAGRRLRVDFADAEQLFESALPGLEWSDDATQAVENRRSLRRNAGRVVANVKELKAAGPDAARSLLPRAELVEALDDHQLVNVAVMTVPDGWGACIFDEQGTGKTVTVIAAFDVLAERNEADVLLVVAPKSMVREWATEFERFTHGLYQVAVIEGSRRERARALNAGAEVVVLNYEAAVGMRDDLRLLARRCRVVLAVDESYNVKNPEAIRTGVLGELREWCDRCFVLCGTPAPNAPGDLVAQFDLVDFGFTFDRLRLVGNGDDQREEIRAAIDARGVYTRHLKHDVLPQLPQKRFVEARVDLAPVQRRLYEKALHDLVLDLKTTTDTEFRRNIAPYLERRNALLRICSNPTPMVPDYRERELPAKLAALDDLLPNYLDAGEKVVLWSFYRASLDALADRYSTLGLVRVDGSVAEASRRRDAVRRFQEDEDVRIFLGNPAAAGAGLTLHRARVAIYESMSNQAAHFMQSLDRIHRRGQNREVDYVVLLCRGTIEETEYQRLLGKADAQADVLGDPTPERPTRQLLLDELLAAEALLDGLAVS